MLTGSIGSYPTMSRPTASFSPVERTLIQDTFVAMEQPDALPLAMAALKTLGQTSDVRLSKQVHVAVAALLAAGTGPLAQTLCKTAFEALQEGPQLKLAEFGSRLAGPLGKRDVPVMGAIATAVTPHYGMAPGSREVIDDVHLFLSPIHDGADIQTEGRVGILKTRLAKLGEFEDDHSYAGYLLENARDGAGGGQLGEVGGRTYVGGVLVRKRR